MPTLEEYFNKTQARKKLVEFLEANIRVLCPDLNEKEIKSMLRIELILIRQCMQDEGVE